MRHTIPIAVAALLALLALAVARSGPAAATRAAPALECGAACVSAYAAIATALPGDRANVLARAILDTPGFDYARLARALHVPTTRELRGVGGLASPR
jgi:hypothetical protein